MTALAAVAIIVATVLLISDTAHEIMHEQGEKLVAIEKSRTSALRNYLESIQQDLSSLAHNEYVLSAVMDFRYGWDKLAEQNEDINAGDQENYLRRLYINDPDSGLSHPNGNPHGLGEKLNWDYAEDGSVYSKVHARYHPWFRHFLLQRDYYDIFLFSPEGDLVYSVFKELDYATNMNSGKYKGTDLANAFRAARDNASDKDHQAFFDFKPYAPSHGAAASFISQPLLTPKGDLAGVLVFQMPIARINAVMQVQAGLGESGETYIVGEDRYMRSDSRFSEESTILKTQVTETAIGNALKGTQVDGRDVHIIDDYRGIPVLSAYGLFEFLGTKWIVLAEVDESEVRAPINALKKKAIIEVLVLLLLITAAGIFFARRISKPITEMSDAMKELAQDNFDVSIPGTDRADEIGDMAASVQVFKENGMEAKQLEAQQAENEKRAEEEKRQLMQDLAQQFDDQVGETIQNLSVSAEKLQDASRSMEQTSQQTQEASGSVAAAAEETSVNVSTVAAATEEMTSAALEISKQVSDVASKASMASQSANETSNKVTDLNQLVENIGEVVNAIRDIAEQTNLLALNATIEAARAGEAGKGFAVVAEEVKKLATETGQKTDEIESRISEIQAATSESVESMQGIISHVSDIDSASSGSAAAVEEQNSVIAEITRNIAEVSEASKEVANVIGSVQAAAGETGQSAQTLKNAADEIGTLSGSLEESVSGFLKKIREG